jgi:hypothetical protein
MFTPRWLQWILKIVNLQQAFSYILVHWHNDADVETRYQMGLYIYQIWLAKLKNNILRTCWRTEISLAQTCRCRNWVWLRGMACRGVVVQWRRSSAQGRAAMRHDSAPSLATGGGGRRLGLRRRSVHQTWRRRGGGDFVVFLSESDRPNEMNGRPSATPARTELPPRSAPIS